MNNQINAGFFTSLDRLIGPRAIFVFLNAHSTSKVVRKIAAFDIEHEAAVENAVKCANNLLASGKPYDDRMVLLHNDVIELKQSIFEVTKEDYVYYVEEVEGIELCFAKGEDTDESERRYEALLCLLKEAPWQIDMDGSGGLANRIIPKVT